MMKPHPANARRHQAMRLAKRAALAGQRLNPDQVKLVLAEHDALGKKSAALMKEHGKVFDAAPPLESGGQGHEGDPVDRAYTVAIRKLDQLDKQMKDLDGRAEALRAHPQISAALHERYKAEERRS